MNGRKGRRTNAEIVAEHIALAELVAESPYDTIKAQKEQIAILQELLTQARLREARLIAMVDSFLDKQEAVA